MMLLIVMLLLNQAFTSPSCHPKPGTHSTVCLSIHLIILHSKAPGVLDND